MLAPTNGAGEITQTIAVQSGLFHAICFIANGCSFQHISGKIMQSFLRSSAVRVLATTAKERMHGYAYVPTMREFNTPINMGPWFGYVASAEVPI